MTKTPTRLKKEPLIDAVFEIRFSATFPASNILPGIYFAKLDGQKSIERLPIADLPSPFREMDPNMQFAPLVRLHWDGFMVLIGDKSLALACKIPYPGWAKFREAILRLLSIFGETGIVTSVERYALKYVDLIPSADLAEQVSFVNVDLKVGTHKLSKEIFQIRIEIPKDGITHAIQISTSASITLLTGEQKEGLIVDVDSTCEVANEPFADFLQKLPNRLETIHTENKEKFFECVRPETIEALEPEYD